MAPLRKAIAIDFDGCLCENKWPEIGAPNLVTIQAALEEQRKGAALILWTCRCGDLLTEAIEWCRSYGLEFDAINENLQERLDYYGCESRKVSADEYWDDRSVWIGSGVSSDTVYLKEIIHIYENSQLTGSFNHEDMTAAYVAGLAALYKTLGDLHHGQ